MFLVCCHFVVGEYFFQRILDFLILRVAQSMKRGETSRASHLLGGGMGGCHWGQGGTFGVVGCMCVFSLSFLFIFFIFM